MKNVLLTGVSGFIGINLLPKLPSGYNYLLLSRKDRPEWTSLPSNFGVVKGSLEKLTESVFPVSELYAIINLAAEIKEESRFESTNITGVEQLCKLAEKMDCHRIIHLSSVGVVGMQFSFDRVVVDEKMACDPKNGYEKSKLKSEEILNQFASAYPTELVILRPTNVFGEHHPKNVLLNLFTHIKAVKAAPMLSNSMVNYVYVGDLTDAIISFLQSPGKTGTFNVGAPATMKEFYKLVGEKLGVAPKSIVLPSGIIRLLESFNYFGLNFIKAKIRGAANRVEYTDAALMNIGPYNHGLEKGLENTVNYYILKGKL